MNKWMTLKDHAVFQINVDKQNKARHDNLDNENTLPKILGYWEKILQNKKFFWNNFFDNEIQPFAVSTGEGETGTDWGRDFY